MQAERQHYPIVCRLDAQVRVLLWYSDAADGVVVDDAGRVANFRTVDRALAYAQTRGLPLAGDTPAVYDLDQLQASLSKDPLPVDCVAFLNFWNLFLDVAASVDGSEAFRQHDQGASSAYQKLFHGNNLPAMTRPGCIYEPIWSKAELAQLSALQQSGIELMRAVLGEAA